MAKIVINIDTEEKSLDVVVNGNTVENVDNVSIYRELDIYGKVAYFSTCIQSKKADGDISTYTRLCANEKTNFALDISDATMGKVQEDIANYIKFKKIC